MTLSHITRAEMHVRITLLLGGGAIDANMHYLCLCSSNSLISYPEAKHLRSVDCSAHFSLYGVWYLLWFYLLPTLYVRFLFFCAIFLFTAVRTRAVPARRGTVVGGQTIILSAYSYIQTASVAVYPY